MGTEERLQRFKRAMTSTPFDERPQTITAGDLGGMFRVGADEAAGALAKAERLGCSCRPPTARTRFRARRCWRSPRRSSRRGISVTGALAVFEELRAPLRRGRRGRSLKLFVRDVWRPFQRADMPPDRWAELDESIERLRPLASDALMAIFQQRMRTQIEAAFGELTQRPSAEAR